MAKIGRNRYNTFILKEHKLYNLSIFALGLALVLALLAAVPAYTSAQSALQNNGGNLQNQTGQTQNSVNTQRQAGGVQNNNSQQTLQQNGNQPLGVVSDPDQANPDAIVPPSDTLKTDITPENNGRVNWWLVLAGVVGITAVLGFFVVKSDSGNSEQKLESVEPEVIPEPLPVKKKKKASGSKKRKKPGRR